jgi:purine-cytosine permease-like protein
VSVFGLAYGAYILGFGVSFAQALIAGVVGIVVSFLFCGIVAIAGKRGSAPTLVMSRAAFGIDGNKLPSAISWLLTVGWETVLVVLATLATSTVFTQLGWGGGTGVEVVALIVVVALTIGAGVIGFDLIMKLQQWITVITGVLTVVYLILTLDDIDWGTVSALPAGSTEQFIGALVFVMTGFGLGWVNAAADYSRYLPRSASTRGVVGWTTLGGALAPIVLVTFGLLLAGSSPELSEAIGKDPIGALAGLLPTWFLVLFVIVAVLGLVGGSVLDIYSSGLALLTLGLRIPRWSAALVDGVIMIVGAVYVVFFADDFFGPFQGFLITLGVPVAAWAGVMMVDIALRRKDYADPELYDRNGRYGSVRWISVILVLLGTAVGWGLVTNTYADWLSWQGYLLGPFGLGGKEGAWAFANIGVLVALVIGALGTLLFSRAEIRAQER